MWNVSKSKRKAKGGGESSEESKKERGSEEDKLGGESRKQIFHKVRLVEIYLEVEHEGKKVLSLERVKKLNNGKVFSGKIFQSEILLCFLMENFLNDNQ